MKKTTKNLTSFLKLKLENPKAIFGGLADENNNNGNGDSGGGTDPIKTSTAGGGMHNSNDRP
ncbi:hypothetical protein NAT51_19325 [Flavobacterium amniphilum]|uniref:hypothetical protein n=1 Tax=Flavobacterium amniphilum TaxID=1834035 RepID=UPI002029EDD7|nr:hypothetical protein [Flavobacterium amniphilum]MCL9807683.1 hypothetical protein [Flavobacterium amniphilum]